MDSDGISAGRTLMAYHSRGVKPSEPIALVDMRPYPVALSLMPQKSSIVLSILVLKAG
jgi:hypothetical protein